MLVVKTPLVIFGFNRPDYIKELLKSTDEIYFEKIYFILDGPRKERENECELVRATAQAMRSFKRANFIEFVAAESNMGCKRRIFSALNSLFSREEELIVLEDDCIPSKDFFIFCESALEKYRNEEDVALVSGSNLLADLVKMHSTEGKSIFINCWGWAGWGSKTLPLLSESIYVADVEEQLRYSSTFNSLPRHIRTYWKQVFKNAIMSNTVWDFYLQLSMFRQEKYSVFPRVNLVNNIGFDERATHTKAGVPKYVLNNIKKSGSYVTSNEKVDYTYEMYRRDSQVTKVLYKFSAFNLIKLIVGNIYRFALKY